MPFYQYDSEEHRERADAVLTRLGKFVVAFERISAGMRSCICCAFTREGLKNQGLCQALINGKAAAGVREALGSIFTELRDQDEADRACVKNLLGRIASLAEKRNTLLHAEWHLNYDYEGATDDFLAFAMKLGSSQKHGAYFEGMDVNVIRLEELIREALEIQVLVDRLGTCLNQRGLKVSDMLSRPL
ncbi:MAG: hypothetical protein H0V62_04425 [Gammaproteobacteria bacterium]|nr:hypothetical protein [Gammaproteobacteria bacterium]